MGSIKKVLVSALVPTYNAERFMRGLLEDLEAQTIADRLEIVYRSTGSPTNEKVIVEEVSETVRQHCLCPHGTPRILPFGDQSLH